MSSFASTARLQFEQHGYVSVFLMCLCCRVLSTILDIGSVRRANKCL